MAVTIEAADAYIDLNVIDVTDWQESENAHKQRILNAGEGTLKRLYPDYVIPDEAVYAYAANLAVAFNDTNKLNNQGIASFSVTGVASFNFKDTDKREMTAFIPEVSKDLIGEANGVKLTGRHTVWTVM